MNERGVTTILFVTIIIPLALLLFSIAVDVEKYFSEVKRSQQVVDDAVLFANRFLPNVAQARQQLEEYLGQRHPGGGWNVALRPGAVEATLRAAVPLTFMKYFNLTSALPVVVSAVAHGATRQVLVVADISAASAPDPETGQLWGDTGEWPSAQYFDQRAVVTDQGRVLDPRAVTALCFNPLLSAIKDLSASLYEVWAAFGSHAVGVSLLPQLRAPSDRLRAVEKPSPDDVREVIYAPFGNRYISNDDCLLAAVTERSHYPYQVPDRQFDYGFLWRPRQSFDEIRDAVHGELGPGAREGLTVRQALWGQTVRPPVSVDFGRAVASIGSDLLGSSNGRPDANLAYIVSAQVPSVFATVADEAERISSVLRSPHGTSGCVSALQISYLLIRSPVSPVSDEAVSQFAAALSSDSRPCVTMRLIPIDIWPEMSHAIAEGIAAEQNRALLAE